MKFEYRESLPKVVLLHKYNLLLFFLTFVAGYSIPEGVIRIIPGNIELPIFFENENVQIMSIVGNPKRGKYNQSNLKSRKLLLCKQNFHKLVFL